MANIERRPLRAGTIIDYCGMRGAVIADTGGETLTVECEGFRQRWRWRFEDAECSVVETPRGALSYSSFDAYVQDFPEAEYHRAWLTNRGRNEVWLYRLVDPSHAGSPHGGLPGNYMAVSLCSMPNGLRLAAHDCDDGLMVRDFPVAETEAAARLLSEMAELAPFSMWEAAKAFDFQWE